MTTPPAQSTFRTPDVAVLPLTTSSPYTYIPVLQTEVTDLPNVAYVDIRADMQFVSELPYVVMHAEYLTATLDGTFGSGTPLLRPMGANWDHADHYALTTLSRIWVPPAGVTSTDVATLTVVAYAASTAAQPGDVVTVKYLDVQVNVYAKGSA